MDRNRRGTTRLTIGNVNMGDEDVVCENADSDCLVFTAGASIFARSATVATV